MAGEEKRRTLQMVVVDLDTTKWLRREWLRDCVTYQPERFIRFHMRKLNAKKKREKYELVRIEKQGLSPSVKIRPSIPRTTSLLKFRINTDLFEMLKFISLIIKTEQTALWSFNKQAGRKKLENWLQ